MTPGPILFYCQHLLGLGHLERAARLARALGRAGEPVIFVQGGRPVPDLDLGGAEVVALPPLVAANEAASGLARPDGRRPEPADLDDRRERLLACLRAYDPSVVLLELFPFGRHALTFELGPLLLALADDRATRGAAAPRVAVSLRDVLVEQAQPGVVRAGQRRGRAAMDRLRPRPRKPRRDPARPHPRARALARRASRVHGLPRARRRAARPAPPHGEIVISAGGGQVGGPLFRTALAAWPLTGAARMRPWRLVTGPYLPRRSPRGPGPDTRAGCPPRGPARGRRGSVPPGSRCAPRRRGALGEPGGLQHRAGARSRTASAPWSCPTRPAATSSRCAPGSWPRGGSSTSCRRPS